MNKTIPEGENVIQNVERNHQPHKVIVVNMLEEYISMQTRLTGRDCVYYQITKQLTSGFDIIPIKLSYFKYNHQIHQCVIETCRKEVEKYLKLAIIQFARSLNAPIINPNFEVRLKTK